MKKICLITGSTGVIGNYISKYLKNKNWRVIRFSNSNKKNTLNYNLKNPEFSDIKKFKRADLLIHCAYDFNQKKWSDIYKTNVLGSKKTFKISYESKIKKIVNISTLSAYPEAISLYGKAKYKIEKLSENYNVINLRCGLVNSNKSKLLNRIKYFAKKFYIFPLIGNGNLKIHLCNLDDIAHFIEKIQTSKIVLNKNFFYICNPNYILLKNLIRSFSKKKLYIKIPIIFVKIFLKITDLMKLPIGFTYDNLLGLINYNPKFNFKKKNTFYNLKLL